MPPSSAMLQIMVNLIANANEAMHERAMSAGSHVASASPKDSKRGACKSACATPGHGIAAEHLPRLFPNGFTTKIDGHGFGLHGAAVAAMGLGGASWLRPSQPADAFARS